MTGLTFTAIDFETANRTRASACSVGLVRVVDGKIVGTAHSLIRPAAAYDVFEASNVKIHGITPDHVIGAPTWAQLLLPVLAFIDGTPLVAHNAAFDQSVFESANASHGLTVPDATFRCSMELAQSRMHLVDHKLPTVASSLGVSLTNHHDATADALASAEIVLRIAGLFQQDTLEGLWSAAPLVPPAPVRRRTGGGDPAYSGATKKKLSELPQAAVDANPANPLYGHVFVFTGNMATMERDDAMDAVARHGGSSGIGVTKKTTYLVATTTGTGKETKARTYIAAGQDIKIITETQFRGLLALADGS